MASESEKTQPQDIPAFPPTGSIISSNTTIKEVSLDCLGYSSEKRTGHVLAFEINDWKELANDKSKNKFYTPTFTISGHEFALMISPYGDPISTDSIGVFICYNDQGRKDWKVLMYFSFVITVNELQTTVSFASRNFYVDHNGLGMKSTQISSKLRTCNKIIILLHYELIDVWKNAKPVPCSIQTCGKDIITPTILDCGHVLCQNCYVRCFDSKCTSLPKCPICYIKKKCICDKCVESK